MIPSRLISVPLLHDAINNNKPFIIHELGLVPGVFVIKSADNTEHIGNVEFVGRIGILVRLQDNTPVELFYFKIKNA